MSEHQTITLPARCATVAAADIRDHLVQATEQDSITVDASEVESIGQAVLQLLVAARREAEASGRAFAIANPSPAFVERVCACRLDEALGIPEGETIQ